MHNHEHNHGSSGDMDAEKAAALLKYNLEHNLHHAEELHDLAHQMERLGLEDAARKVIDAYEAYKVGNKALQAAVDKL